MEARRSRCGARPGESGILGALIESADPESLRVWGFVHQPSAPGHATTAEEERGPIYYGPDARVLFSEWFLASHCFRVKEDAGLLEVRFVPQRRGDRAAIEGSLRIDRGSMELRRLDFEYVGLPRWASEGVAGGFVELRRLREGAWVPRAWMLRAPQAVRTRGSPWLRLKGWLETGGRVTAVRTAEGELDPVSTAELLPRPRHASESREAVGRRV